MLCKPPTDHHINSLFPEDGKMISDLQFPCLLPNDFPVYSIYILRKQNYLAHTNSFLDVFYL